jgi:iron complex outermembrane receptor protein
MSLSLLEGSTDQSATVAAQRIPRHQASLRWMAQVSRSIDADLIWRYVDAMPAYRVVPYQALDARVSYRAYGWLELSIIGRNLLDPRHQEFSRSPGFPGISEFPSYVYGKIVVTPP